MIKEPDVVRELKIQDRIKNLFGTKKDTTSKNPSKIYFIEQKTIEQNQEKFQHFIASNLEEMYKTIFENAAVAITVTDKLERIISWNSYTEFLLGKTKSDLYLKSVSSLYPEEEWKKIRAENIRQKGMQHHLETKIIRENNEPLDVDISLSVVKNNKGEVIGSIGVIKDISERKRAEEQVKLAHEKLNQINKNLEQKIEERTVEVKKLLKQKDEFINQLGHDLKSPLTPVLNLLPKVINSKEDPKTLERLEIINRNVNYISHLVTDTLKLAKLNSKSIQLDVKPINLLKTIDDVLNCNENLIKENDIYIKKFIEKDIYILADETQIVELITNLLTNAVKYSPDNSIVVISAEKKMDEVIFSICDNGQGMTKEQIEHIFDEFYKADESRHNFNSSGLGLAICKKIIHRHGGNLWAESKGVGKGSTFYFSIKAT